jgi:hypothetical protein
MKAHAAWLHGNSPAGDGMDQRLRGLDPADRYRDFAFFHTP